MDSSIGGWGLENDENEAQFDSHQRFVLRQNNKKAKKKKSILNNKIIERIKY